MIWPPLSRDACRTQACRTSGAPDFMNSGDSARRLRAGVRCGISSTGLLGFPQRTQISRTVAAGLSEGLSLLLTGLHISSSGRLAVQLLHD